MDKIKIYSPVSDLQFNELVNRFGDNVVRVGDQVEILYHEPHNREFVGLAKEHGYKFTGA